MSAENRHRLLTTPLRDIHGELGARMIEFGGWEMPVSYKGILAEHRATRERAGLFDLSHMGELLVGGPDAGSFLGKVLTRDPARARPGTGAYSLLLNPSAGIIDDVIFYNVGETLGWLTDAAQEATYLVVVNAANTSKDADWFLDNARGYDVSVSDGSRDIGLIAIQGPYAQAVLAAVFAPRERGADPERVLEDLPYFGVVRGSIRGAECLVARTGYTGEDGFEVFSQAWDAPRVWHALMDAGPACCPGGLEPVGLGARDTLRLEMGYPLYGHELDESTNPVDAGLMWTVDMKGDRNFVGRDVLVGVLSREAPARRELVGFEVSDRSIPRQGCLLAASHEVPAGGRPDYIGSVTSGSMSPTLGRPIGMGYVAPRFAAPGTQVAVEVRGHLSPARVVRPPFVPSRVRKAARRTVQ